MKKEIVNETRTVQVIKYIASDGKAFDDEDACSDYESVLAQDEKWRQITFKYSTGCKGAPLDYEDYDSDKDEVFWFKLESKDEYDDFKELSDVLVNDWNPIKEPMSYPAFICLIRAEDNAIYNAGYLSDSINYVKIFLSQFKIEASFKREGVVL